MVAAAVQQHRGGDLGADGSAMAIDYEPPAATGRMPPVEKRQRVEVPGAEQLVGALAATAAAVADDDEDDDGGGDDNDASLSNGVTSSSPTTTTSSALAAGAPTSALTMPAAAAAVVVSSSPSPTSMSLSGVGGGGGGGGGRGPPHLHPTRVPNPNLGPQPGAAPTPIIDAETLRQAYAAVAGSMPPGLFMPHTLLGGGSAGDDVAGSGSGGDELTGVDPGRGGGQQPVRAPLFESSSLSPLLFLSTSAGG